MLNVVHIALSHRGDYAVRAVLDLAQHYGHGRRKTREIAGAMHIPQNYLSQILADLVSRGLLHATAGQAGGYELTRPPAQISLLAVVELAEGPVSLQRCMLRGIPCGSDGYCAAHEAWAAAQGALSDRLAATTFADLARSADDVPRAGTRARAAR